MTRISKTFWFGFGAVAALIALVAAPFIWVANLLRRIDPAILVGHLMFALFIGCPLLGVWYCDSGWRQLRSGESLHKAYLKDCSGSYSCRQHIQAEGNVFEDCVASCVEDYEREDERRRKLDEQ